MEAEYQNSVLPDCHDVDDRQPQNFIELGEQFFSPGNVPEETVYRSALNSPYPTFTRLPFPKAIWERAGKAKVPWWKLLRQGILHIVIV